MSDIMTGGLSSGTEITQGFSPSVTEQVNQFTEIINSIPADKREEFMNDVKAASAKYVSGSIPASGRPDAGPDTGPDQ